MARVLVASLCLLVAREAAAQSSVLISDTFTGADGTALSSHTPDSAPVGAGWTSFSGTTARLWGNRAGVSGPSGTYQIWSVNSGVADVIVAGDVTSTASSPMGGLMLRGTDANNYWTVVLQDSRVVLYKVVGGNYTHRGQFIPPVVSGQTYRLEVRATGSQYDVYVNGTFRFTTTDSFLNTATRHGLLWHNSDSTTTIDNFEVRTASSPIISTLAPTSGAIGTSVTITGTNFGATQGTSTVRFNGTTATTVPSWSNTSITATVPAGATTGPVTVVTSSGGVSNGVTFTLSAPGVLVSDTFTGTDGTALSSHTPDGAPPGAGWTSFSGTTARLWGNRAGVSGPSGTYQVWSLNSGVADVIVAGDMTSTASSPMGGLMLRGTDANNYWTVVLQDSRVVLYKVVAGNYTHRGQFIPPVASGQTYRLEVRATGSQYDVYVNGTFRFTTTDSFLNTATRHGLLWHNSDSTLTVDNFEVRTGGSAPVISALTPTAGPVGSSVTISGTNFGATQGTSTVRFNGTTATTGNWSNTSITATVPSAATSGPVTVTVNGQVSNSVTFAVAVPPTISAVTPTTAPVAASVVVTGTNFGSSQGASTIRFNTTVAQPTAWNSTTITVPVPSGATSGPVTVIVNGQASNGVAFTVAPDPYITGLSTTFGAIGAPVTITGASFGASQGSSTVTFNGTSAGAASTWSATSISVNVPAGATTGDIRVTVGGLASNGVPFTVTGPPPPSCSFDVLPSNVTVGYPSAQVTFFITASENNCEWQAQAVGGFVSLIGNAIGEGDASVVYHVADNPGTEWRAAQLTIAGKTVSVTQRGTGSMSLRAPYFGYYNVLEGETQLPFNYIEELSGYANIAYIAPDRVVLTPSHAQQLTNANMRVVVELGISEARLAIDPAALEAYLDQIQEELVGANMWNLVVAVAPGEEWHRRVTDQGDEAYTWSMFSGITPETHPDCGTPQTCWVVLRRDLIRDRLNNVIATIKNRWNKQTMLVDEFWNNTFDLWGNGSLFYYPIPSNLDILGMDAYMGSSGHTADCGPGMQEKFYLEVRRKYDHLLFNYSAPIWMVGQSFNDGARVMPSPCQLQWWYELAQSSTRFAGLFWFTYGLPGDFGVRNYPEQRTWLRSMYRYNQSLP